MSLLQSLKRLTWYEYLLWGSSVLLLVATFVLSHNHAYLTLIASLIGVSALMFLAKGDVLGQVLTIVFSLCYALVAFQFRYYGEMITYLGMTLPIAALAVYTWIKHPYDRGEVRVAHTKPLTWVILLLSALLVTFGFYFILLYFRTPNLLVSTISVTTSFLAASLTMLRSPYYALFYAANDVVLIVLWVLATLESPSYLPMIINFSIFLLQDIYGFINWQRMKHRQGKESSGPT